MVKTTEKITAKKLQQIARAISADQPTKDIFDSEIQGFHVRSGAKSISFRIKYQAPNSNTQRIYTIGHYPKITAEQAREQAKDLLGRVARGEDVQEIKRSAKKESDLQKQQTLKAYLWTHYKVYQDRHKKGKETLSMISNHFTDLMGRPLSKITSRDIERWQATKEAEGLAWGTITRIFGALRTMLNHAATKGFIDSNPIKGYKLTKPAMTEIELSKAGASRRYLEAYEVTALFKALDDYQEIKRQQRRNSRSHGKLRLPDWDVMTYVDHVKPMVLMMYYTGFRSGDMFGLRWEHVNLNFATITKTIEKTAHHNPEPRSFPISKPLVKILTDWHQQRGKPISGYVFPSERTGGRMSKNAMQTPWAKIRQLAGLPTKLVLYTLRHNFASQLIMAGVDLLAVSELMAHKDIHTTIKNYGHLRPDHKRHAVDLFANTALMPSDTTGLPEVKAVTN
ncbi:Site-specific recombinase XerD [Oceanospirillum multiglobuliferum]|uniref:Integrase n=1 Tax=Oceanospirillum multiglobuliferum TaxID=64969 RepID=A0A1T4QCM6_9GAMM|nr:site-specific integrase [Oceanospirillum multiglobuliferum]OPX56518.1 integrase [Oceanospirillum multiglobuliferum]SKA01387.1 Site-specific recombinase XerD [Oceanospirillum multiglobuliferum]